MEVINNCIRTESFNVQNYTHEINDVLISVASSVFIVTICCFLYKCAFSRKIPVQRIQDCSHNNLREFKIDTQDDIGDFEFFERRGQLFGRWESNKLGRKYEAPIQIPINSREQLGLLYPVIREDGTIDLCEAAVIERFKGCEVALIKTRDSQWVWDVSLTVFGRLNHLHRTSSPPNGLDTEFGGRYFEPIILHLQRYANEDNTRNAFFPYGSEEIKMDGRFIRDILIEGGGIRIRKDVYKKNGYLEDEHIFSTIKIDHMKRTHTKADKYSNVVKKRTWEYLPERTSEYIKTLSWNDVYYVENLNSAYTGGHINSTSFLYNKRNPFKIYVTSKYSRKSVFDNSIVSPIGWNVFLIRFDGKCGQHAELVLEGIRGGKYEKHIAHLTVGGVKVNNNTNKITNYHAIIRAWKVPVWLVDRMLEIAIAEMSGERKAPKLDCRTTFVKIKGTVTCLDWAIDKLQTMNITLSPKHINHLTTRFVNITSFYGSSKRDHPDEGWV